MKIELSQNELRNLLGKQLEALFMYDRARESEQLSHTIDIALEQCEHCFRHSENKYYWKDSQVYFNPFHSGQYAIFLYFLSHAIFVTGKSSSTLADRIYYLNKCLNGLDLFYEVKMPRVFFLDHPVGSVLGRATYGERFSFTQNCTVGNNRTKYPTFGKNVKMMSGSKVLGECLVGDNVIISANTYIKDLNVPSCSIVFGSYPNLTIKNKHESYFTRFQSDAAVEIDNSNAY